MATDSAAQTAPEGMPANVERALADLVAAAQQSFQDDLQSVVLFGSGAEGRLRATSDLNLLVVLTRFEQQRADQFREPLRLAHVAVRAEVMFVLEAELPAVAEAFAVKFGDIARRSRVLYGVLPAALQGISPQAKRLRLRQMLMNLALRLRNAYVATSLREEQLALAIADMSGPLRTAAATLLELEGQTPASPKQALETVAGALDGGRWSDVLHGVSAARESRRMAPGTAGPIAFQLMDLLEAMRQRVERRV